MKFGRPSMLNTKSKSYLIAEEEGEREENAYSSDSELFSPVSTGIIAYRLGIASSSIQSTCIPLVGFVFGTCKSQNFDFNETDL